MKRSWIQKCLYEYYDTYDYLCHKYPKAAKRERVRKKWAARYGTYDGSLIYGSLIYGSLIFGDLNETDDRARAPEKTPRGAETDEHRDSVSDANADSRTSGTAES